MLKINHVMSAEISSGIFKDLLNYHINFSGEDVEIIESVNPVNGADIYHYHRPHLEKELLSNSVVTVHHDLEDTDKWLEFSKFKPRYSEAKRIICLNSNQEKYLNKVGLSDNVIIPHGYNNRIFSKPNKQKSIDKKLNIGVISKRYGRKVKGEAYLLELYKRLDNTKISFTFVGADRTFSSWKAREYGFETESFERLPYNCFGSLYRSIDCLLITSLYEGGPANIPEAIISSTPIVSTPIGMATDYIRDNINGIILTGDLDIDAEKINDLADCDNYHEFAKQAFLSADTALSWQDVVCSHIKLYKEIVEGN